MKIPVSVKIQMVVCAIWMMLATFELGFILDGTAELFAFVMTPVHILLAVAYAVMFSLGLEQFDERKRRYYGT